MSLCADEELVLEDGCEVDTLTENQLQEETTTRSDGAEDMACNATNDDGDDEDIDEYSLRQILIKQHR